MDFHHSGLNMLLYPVPFVPMYTEPCEQVHDKKALQLLFAEVSLWSPSFVPSTVSFLVSMLSCKPEVRCLFLALPVLYV